MELGEVARFAFKALKRKISKTLKQKPEEIS